MAIALIVLSIFSLVGGWVGFPHHHFLEDFLMPVFIKQIVPAYSHGIEYGLMGMTILSTLAVAIWTFYTFHKNRSWTEHMKIKFSKIHRIISDKYYVDEFYDRVFVQPVNRISDLFLKWIDTFIIEGVVNGLGRLSVYLGGRYTIIQNGNLGSYAFAFVIGVVLIFLYYWNRF